MFLFEGRILGSGRSGSKPDGGRHWNSTHKESVRIEPKLSGCVDNMPTKIKILSRIIYKSFQRVIQDLARGSRIPDPKFGRREICYNSVFPLFNEPSFWYVVDILCTNTCTKGQFVERNIQRVAKVSRFTIASSPYSSFLIPHGGVPQVASVCACFSRFLTEDAEL